MKRGRRKPKGDGDSLKTPWYLQKTVWAVASAVATELIARSDMLPDAARTWARLGAFLLLSAAPLLARQGGVEAAQEVAEHAAPTRGAEASVSAVIDEKKGP